MIKQKPTFRFGKYIGMYIGGFMLLMFGCTYGKWEILSWLYASEFYPAIKQASDDGCLTAGYPQVVKVIEYSHSSAVVWYKGKSGSTYIGNPWRSSKQPNWQFSKTSSEKREGSSGRYCDLDVIRSRTGGSADGYYWYN